MNYVVLSLLVLRTKGLAAPLKDASGPGEHASSVVEVEDLNEKSSADLLSDLLLELQSQTTGKTTAQSVNLVRTTSFLSQTTVKTPTAQPVKRVKTTSYQSQATVKTIASESQTTLSTSTIHSETTVKPTTVQTLPTTVITTTAIMLENVETQGPRQHSSREVTPSPVKMSASDKQMWVANINEYKGEHNDKQDYYGGVEIANETINDGCQPERWCHSTFSNEYHSKKEEECKETFAR